MTDDPLAEGETEAGADAPAGHPGLGPAPRDHAGLRAAVDAVLADPIARRPDGAAMLRFRRGQADGAAWLVSARLGSGPPVAVVRSCLGLPSGVDPADPALGYWIAHAVRQDAARALAGAKAVSLVVGIDPAGDGVAVTLAVFGRSVPGRGKLERAMAPARIARHRGWAIARTRAGGVVPAEAPLRAEG
ncbi:MAG: hypothetical protein ACFBWO_14210 [Paracoccaceae bacterium]